MLAIRLRVRPCRDRCVGSSDERSMRSWESSRTTLICGGTWRVSSPRGPLTRTEPASTSTLTLPGTAIGIVPIRDMAVIEASVLPDVGEDFAADFQAARPRAAHDALRRGQDGGAKPAEDARDVF